MPAPSLTPETFIDHWSKAEANERAISQPFLLELTDPSSTLHAAVAPVTAQELTTRFTRAKPQAVQEILESLVALGRAQRNGERIGMNAHNRDRKGTPKLL